MLALATIAVPALPSFSSPPGENPVIHFGVIPRYNPMLMYRSYQPLMDYLTENTPYRFELKLSRNYTEAVTMLRQGVTPIYPFSRLLDLPHLLPGDPIGKASFGVTGNVGELLVRIGFVLRRFLSLAVSSQASLPAVQPLGS